MSVRKPMSPLSTPAGVQRVCVLLATFALIMFCQLGRAAAQGHDFRICEGDFALCAASTCQPTGGKSHRQCRRWGDSDVPRI